MTKKLMIALVAGLADQSERPRGIRRALAL